MKKATIYRIITPTNHIYVGCTTSLKDRMNDYRTLQCKAQRLIYEAMVKYPFDICKFMIIEVCDIDIKDEVEMFWIKEFKSHRKSNKKGLNLTMGGIGFTGNCMEGNLIRSRRGRFAGENNPNYGRTHTEEVRRKISERHKGNTIWVGRKHKEISKLKISLAKKGKPSGAKGRKMRKEVIEAMSERQSYLILNTETGIYYLGTREAAVCHNINRNTLKGWLVGTNRNKSSLCYV